MHFGEIICHEISNQYQLKNTSYFHYNGFMVKGYHTQTIHGIKFTVLHF